MKLSVQPHQASQGRRFAIVNDLGHIMLTTFDNTDQCRKLAQQAAAAPDMLERIKLGLKHMLECRKHGCPPDMYMIVAFEEAIAKAEGRTD